MKDHGNLFHYPYYPIAIKNYFNDLYTSACSARQEEYDSFIQELRLAKLCEEDRDELEGP